MTDVVASLATEMLLDDRKFQSGIRGVKSSLTGITSTIGQVGSALGIALGAGASVNAASQFGKQLTNIESLGGRTKAEMAGLNKELLAMGKNTILENGPQSAVNAFYDIASGVQGADKQMAIFRSSLATAEAGQADLTATTAGTVATMNAYKLEAKDATMVSDVFTRTVGLGVGTMNEFVGAMSPIAGMSAQMGVKFKDLGGMMAFLTTKGVGVAESATQVRSIMSALLTPNKKMTDQFKKLGISSGEAAIKQYGMVGTLELLKKSVGGNEQAMGEMLGRIEAVSGAMQLTSGGFKEFSQSFESGLAGATEAARNIQLDSFSAKWQKLQNQLSGLGVQIGQELLPPLSGVVDWVSNGITSLDKIHPAIVPATAGFVALGAAIGPLKGLLSGVGAGITAILSPAGLLIGAIAIIGGLAIQHFGGLDKLLVAAATSARQLTQIVGFGLFSALNSAAQGAQSLVNGLIAVNNALALRGVEALLGGKVTIGGGMPSPYHGQGYGITKKGAGYGYGTAPTYNPYSKKKGGTPFASYGQGSGAINMITGERRPEMVSFDGAGNWAVKPMNRDRGSGNRGNITIYVMDRDLEARLESILERELSD